MHKRIFMWVFIIITLSLLSTSCEEWKMLEEEFEVTGNTLTEKLAWLQTHARSHHQYILYVSANEYISPTSLFDHKRNKITIRLKSSSNVIRTIGLLSNGSMFTIESGITLVLENNITLQGLPNNTRALVTVNKDGLFIMKNGSVVGNNTANYPIISTDLFSLGGGVKVFGSFLMEGGSISNNRIVSPNSSQSAQGSGVFVYRDGLFTMNGGEIINNTFIGEAGWSGGGGVTVSGTFTMNGGNISGNTAFSSGGGVYVHGTFILNGGTISDNAARWGGGIFIGSLTADTKKTLIMTGGLITNNTAENFGGGAYVSAGIINKTDGTITSCLNDANNGNRVRNTSGSVISNSGHAVYAIKESIVKRKEYTAGTNVNLWFDGKTNNYASWTGSWDY